MRRRMAQHPKAVSLDEARRVLEAYGWSLLRVTGSHHIFRASGRNLSIPRRRPHILPTYVKDILQATEGKDDDDDDA